uniref:glucuronosyltransferase n=1 Tax=Steinernema glaseri TaxID=37863 RepID=A0A1I8AHY5_9BILA
TVFLPLLSPNVKTNGTKLAKTVTCPAAPGVPELFEGDEHISATWTQSFENPIAQYFQTLKFIADTQAKQCAFTIQQDELLEQLRNEKFDLGITEVFDACGLGLFEVLGIKAHIVTCSTIMFEGVAKHIGLDLSPSYVPSSISTQSDQMSYLDRWNNFVSGESFNAFYDRVASQEHKMFQKKFGDDFISLDEKIAQASFAFVNADPLVDFPRTINAKVVYVGGIAVKETKPLDKYWEDIMNLRKDAFIVSFGMYVQGYTMPEPMKKALLAAFKEFPHVTFIWKYEKEEDEIAKGLDNVLTFKSIPQGDLLAHKNLRGFLTHGGMNSVTEASHRGVPLITVPILGDQMRNAKMVERMGTAIHLHKSDLANADKVIDAFRKLLTNESYSIEAKRVAAMIANRPIPVKTLLVRHVEFAAQFGQLKKLDSVGRTQSFIVYHSLDIWGAIVLALATIVFVLLKIVLVLLRKLLASKPKKD